MIRLTITNAVVSKGYNGADALRFTEKDGTKFVRFRIGATVYDKSAENNRRFINFSAKAFNGMCTRIEKMQLGAGSYVNIVGKYDEESWEDQTTHEKKSAPVLTVEEIEFCYAGDRQNGNASRAAGNAASALAQGEPPAGENQTPENFTGFEPFGGMNPFFPEES
jgi:hypothetical protein